MGKSEPGNQVAKERGRARGRGGETERWRGMGVNLVGQRPLLDLGAALWPQYKWLRVQILKYQGPPPRARPCPNVNRTGSWVSPIRGAAARVAEVGRALEGGFWLHLRMAVWRWWGTCSQEVWRGK